MDRFPAGGALSSASGALELPVTAACTLDEVDGAPRITTMELTVRARVPGRDEDGLERSVARAADLRPVSNALRDNVELSGRADSDDG